MEYGIVKEIKDNRVVVSMVRTDACAGCRACKMGHEQQEMIIEAINECDANIGDKVGVEISTDAFISATLIMYALPLLGFLVGIGAGYALSYGIYKETREYIPIMLGVVFLALTFLLIKVRQGKHLTDKYNPKAIHVERGNDNESSESEVKSQ